MIYNVCVHIKIGLERQNGIWKYNSKLITKCVSLIKPSGELGESPGAGEGRKSGTLQSMGLQTVAHDSTTDQ